MNGRVKSLHPKIYAGILARRNEKNDLNTLKDHQYPFIDLVVCNLYPFEKTISKKDSTLNDAIEHIDIGGPTMIRAAAKNFQDVTILTDPNDYSTVLNEIQMQGNTSPTTRQQLATKAFGLAAHYNTAINQYLSKQSPNTNTSLDEINLTDYQPLSTLRYGENPQQNAMSYAATHSHNTLLTAPLLQGKPLSYNNLIDANAAISVIRALETSEPTCAIIKHATPCGVATGLTLTQAYQKAFACDPQSAFGGIIALNSPLTGTLADTLINQQFIEVIVAPAIEPSALETLAKKPNIRLLHYPTINQASNPSPQIQSIDGGLLIQTMDHQPLSTLSLHCPTQKTPTEQQQKDLLFAWSVVKCVKSNAIVYAKNGASFGIGSGQTSRVFSAQIAVLKAQQASLNLDQAVMASDAFLPFPDTLDVAYDAGIRAVIQPGGSKQDPIVIQHADELGISMLMTGTRHFKH